MLYNGIMSRLTKMLYPILRATDIVIIEIILRVIDGVLFKQTCGCIFMFVCLVVGAAVLLLMQ